MMTIEEALWFQGQNDFGQPLLWLFRFYHNATACQDLLCIQMFNARLPPVKKITVREREPANGNRQIPGFKFCYTKNIPSATRQKSCRQRNFSCPVTWMKTTLLIPSYHILIPPYKVWDPASCSNLLFSDVCPRKKYWELVAASRASGHRFSPNVALKGFVFSKQSHGCQSHISEIMIGSWKSAQEDEWKATKIDTAAKSNSNKM